MLPIVSFFFPIVRNRLTLVLPSEFGDISHLKYIFGVYLAMAFFLHGSANCQFFQDDKSK